MPPALMHLAHPLNRLEMTGPVPTIIMTQQNRKNSSDSDLPQVKQKRRRTLQDYVLIKHWVTGEKEKAAMEDEDIDNEMFNETRAFMSASLLRKLPVH